MCELYTLLGYLLVEADKLEESVAILKERMAKIPNDAGTHVSLGDLLYESGKGDEAMAVYFEAEKADPSDY